jgi:hypothetical protein
MKRKGAYRLFVLAKAVAGARDHINIQDVRAIAPIGDKQFGRDLSSAVKAGILHDEGNGVYHLASHRNAALLLGATRSSEARHAEVSLGDLYSNKWLAIAFVTWQAITTQNGLRLISQKKQAEMTGISPQAQREYNRTMEVKSRSNYAVSNILANNLDAVKEFGKRAAPFAFKDHKLKQWYIAWRLPSTRKLCAYSSVSNTCIGGRRVGTKQHGSTLFIHSAETSFTRAKKKASPSQRDIYVFVHLSRSGAGIFSHFPA